MREQKTGTTGDLFFAPRAQGASSVVVFFLDGRRYALPLLQVTRIVRAADITPLPDGPESVLGIINFQGKVIPVFNVRRRFRLPEREMLLSDQFVVAGMSRRTAALPVDEAGGVLALEAGKTVPPGDILPSMPCVEGVVKLEDGLILIHDLDKFLSLDEERVLEKALSIHAGRDAKQ